MIIGETTPPGYKMVHIPRPQGRRGGGVGLIHRTNIKVKNETGVQFMSFEHMAVTLSAKSTVIRIIVLYRPPLSKKNGLKFTTFLEEFSKLLEDVMLLSGKLYILGD